MLTAQRLSLRFPLPPWWVVDAAPRRHARLELKPIGRVFTRQLRQRSSDVSDYEKIFHARGATAGRSKLSLAEQLFPEESKRHEASQTAPRDVPRIPVEAPSTLSHVQVTKRDRKAGHISAGAAAARAQRRAEEPHRGILVLRCASHNLTEEEFRRVEPRGLHIEGWKLDEGRIERVIPGRHKDTLAPDGSYLILFSSRISAFEYQGHVTRIHRMAVANTPDSLMSNIKPPPGYIIQDIDAHAALEAYTLIPPTQPLELRSLKPPWSPLVNSIVHHGGRMRYMRFKDKSKFELRLTLEGPQLGVSEIRWIIYKSGQTRGLSWSGDDKSAPRVLLWYPYPPESSQGPRSTARGNNNANRSRSDIDSPVDDEDVVPEPVQALEESSGGGLKLKRRTPGNVFIIGFPTETSAESFRAHWHRRPMQWPPGDHPNTGETDAPPITNVQKLW